MAFHRTMTALIPRAVVAAVVVAEVTAVTTAVGTSPATTRTKGRQRYEGQAARSNGSSSRTSISRDSGPTTSSVSRGECQLQQRRRRKQLAVKNSGGRVRTSRAHEEHEARQEPEQLPVRRQTKRVSVAATTRE